MNSAIPFREQANPITGFTNSRLGTWLFIASEVMLFGALFSSYVVLRSGAVRWPEGSHELKLAWGVVSTLLLLLSSVTTALMEGAIGKDKFNSFRRYLLFSVILGVCFLVVEALEWGALFGAGNFPSTNNFYALYFVLTGVHALHVLGGVAVYSYFMGPGSRIYSGNPRLLSTRIECAALYWYFVDIVWVALFITFYLL